ncbi:MAG: radical SAM family heme chaperone HemW [Prevotella sp.]|nr:radical SAM family heme chaperone HemW [Prevotella sp.]
MAGLYIHIPFCASRCIYCGFYSTTSLKLRQRYVDAVCREMETHPFPLPKGMGIDTIYFGGGTPSQLTIPQLEQLFLYINKVYSLTTHLSPLTPEITIEMNPDDVTPAWADVLPRLGVNRVSMGAQTFNDERLRFLHRRHTARQVPEAVKILRNAGIRNISIDLMYGFPSETLDDWQRDIDSALALNVEHISAYCLMIEEGTPLWRLKMKDEKLKMPDEELERLMYEVLIDKLTAAGYEHYEISNFAKPGYRSHHNSSYWQDVPYIGLGAAAHSYDLKYRSYNVADIQQYIEAIEHGELPSEQEVIDEDTHYNDRITVALRTSDGLDLTTISDLHRRYCMKEAQRFIDDGLLQLSDNRLSLTRKGLFVSDYIMSSLIMV